MSSTKQCDSETLENYDRSKINQSGIDNETTEKSCIIIGEISLKLHQ